MKKSIILIIGLLFGLYAFGQQDQNKWRLGLHAGIISYKGDINNDWMSPNAKLNNLNDNHDYLSYSVSLEKSISSALGLRVSYTKGQFEAFDRAVDWDGDLQLNANNFNRALNVRTELSDWSLLLTYNFDNGYILPAGAFVAPYLTAGLGYTDFQTYGDLLRADNARYYYWADGTVRDVDEFSGLEGQEVSLDGTFETRLSDLKTEGKDYDTYLFHATAGLGLKFRLGSRFNLNLETLLRFTNSDYLDDVSGDYLAGYDSEFQNYAAVPGAQVGIQRGNSNGSNDAYAFTSLSLHYNFGRKRESTHFPDIRIGLLSDLEMEVAEVEADTLVYDEGITEIIDTTVTVIEEIVTIVEEPLDTQAIYVVHEIKDTTFLLETLDSTQLMADVDTIRIIGDSIYLSDASIDSVDLASDQFLVDEYLRTVQDSVYSLDSVALLVPDTQFLFVVREEIDSVRLLRDAQLMDSMLLLGNIEVDTFYQVGDSLLQSDLQELITEEDWGILRSEVIDINDSLEMTQNYEEYLIEKLEEKVDTVQLLDVELTVLDSTVLNSISSPVVEDVDVEAIQDSTNNVIAVETSEVQDSINTVVTSTEILNTVTVDSVLRQRIAQMQMELDSLKLSRESVKSNEVIVDQVLELPVSPSDTSENQRVIQLMNRVAQLEQISQQQDKEEIEQLKTQLAAYKAKEEERLSLENAKLRSEIIELKNSNATQTQTPVIIQTPTPPSSNSNAEVNQLKSEVAAMNQNMELMKQLLLQQQVMASLSQQPENKEDTEDNSAAMAMELAMLRAELTELRSGIQQQDTVQQQPLIVTMPVKGDRAEVDSLKLQLLLIQQELNDLKRKPAPETKVEQVIVEVPVAVEKPVDIGALIRGRNQQIVFFAIGASKLSSTSLSQVQSIIQLMQEYPELNVQLDAFTDSSGDATRNLALSKKRAESVKAALMRSGISGSRIQMNFNGEDETNDEAFGRRVELKAYLPTGN